MSVQARYQFGPFQLDPAERECRRGDELIPITGKAFDLLHLLVRNPGRTIPKADLMTALWKGTAVEESNLTQTIFLLRKALGDDSDRATYVQTVPRQGYKFVAPVTSDAPASVPAVPIPVDERTQRRHWVLGFTTLAAIVVAATILLGRGESPHTTPHALTPFESGAGASIMTPVWSPDGKGIAFGVQRNETEVPQLYVKYFDASMAMQLTHDQAGGTPIAWTSGRIVLQSSRAPAGLWTITPASGESEPLLAIRDVKARNSAHVSTDGTAVAYYDADKDGVYGVMISSPAGSPPRPYALAPYATQTRLGGPQVKFSPDGKQIVLFRNAGAGEEAWLMPYPADTSKPPRRILRSLPKSEGTPTVSWMPDNRRIVLGGMSSDSQPSDLYMVDTASGEYSALLSGTTHTIKPAVSPDGKKLIFQEITNDRDLVSIDLASATVRPLLATATRRNESEPGWASNGSAMVYGTDRNGISEVWLHKPGEHDRPLVTSRDFPPGTTAQFMSPVLSPDGGRLIYARTERPGPTLMWMSAVAGSTPVPSIDPALVAKGEIYIPGSWSPDGRWIAFLKFLNGKADLYKVKTTGQAQPELLKAGLKRSGSGSVPIWSPTGEWILTEDDGMKLFSADGKETRALASRNVTVCGFSRDGALLYCMRQERTSDPGVFFSVPVAGGPEKVIGPVAPENKPLFGGVGLRLSLTPDRKSLAYSIRKTTSNLWLMDGIE